MAEIEDFEIIDDTSFTNEPTFVFINENGPKQKPADSNSPPLSPKPLIEETLQIVEEQPTLAITPTIQPEIPVSTVDTDVPITTFTPIKPTVIQAPPTPRIFAPVPVLPKAPPLKRFGVAANIPHNINASLDVDTIIDKSRENQKTALYISARQQQQHDVQTVLEQRRRIQTIFDNMASGSAFSNVLKAKEDLQKSPEQLEQEKRSVIAQRVPQLQLDGKTKEDLIEKAKQLHSLLHQLHGNIYELTERFERQKYDMVELTERARQIEKGKAKTRKSNIVHTGLGGGIFSGVNDFAAKAPPKVSLFSRYERLTDRRTFKDRRDVWASEKKSENFVAERPKAKIKKVTEDQQETVPRKSKAAAKPKEEEAPPPPADEPEETPAAEEPAAEEEEQPAAEEAPAEEAPAEEAAAEEEEEEEE